MKTLSIFCAGAAKAVVSRAAQRQRQSAGALVTESYGAVGALKSELLAGGVADVVILTAELIDDLIARDWIRPGSRVDIGQVGTGIAVRNGVAAPDLTTIDALRSGLLAAGRVICPDPAFATAGKVLLATLETLGITAQVTPKLEFTSSGYAAMDRLASGRDAGELGFMQMTEIVASDDVVLAAPLPPALQKMTTYSAGIPVRSANAGDAQAFVRALVEGDAQAVLRAAGFVGIG